MTVITKANPQRKALQKRIEEIIGSTLEWCIEMSSGIFKAKCNKWVKANIYNGFTVMIHPDSIVEVIRGSRGNTLFYGSFDTNEADFCTLVAIMSQNE